MCPNNEMRHHEIVKESVLGRSKVGALAIMIVACLPVHAQFNPTYDWKSDAPGTDFLDPNNWAPGLFAPPGNKVPSTGDIGKIANGGVATLSGGSHQISLIEIGSLGSGQLSLLNGAVLEVLSPGATTFGRLLLGVGSAGDGSLQVSGASRLTTGRGVIVGSGGTAEVSVDDGGRLEVGGELVIGGNASNHTGAVGTFNVGSGEGDGLGGEVAASSIKFGYGRSIINFNHGNTDGINISSDISMIDATVGVSEVNHLSQGLTRLSGNTINLRGDTMISAGTLVFGGANMSLDGDVSVEGGGLALGMSDEGNRAARILDISGNLLLTSESTLQLGMGAVSDGSDPDAVGSGDLIRVGGTLLLDGAITIFDIGGEGGGPGFGVGRYELITYGVLHDDSRIGSVNLDLAGGLNGSLTVDNTDTGGRIILTIDAGLGSLAFWALTDGDWGSSAWSATENLAEPWVDWADGTGAVFRGPDGGNVTISHADGVLISSLAIETNGYVIRGDEGGGSLRFAPSDPEGPALVRFNVNDGIHGHIAAAVEEDTAGLRFFKDGTGILVLSSDDNHWTGGTTVNSGRLVIGSGGTSGALPGDVRLFGTLAFDRADEYVFAGQITEGGGTLRQIGDGTLVLTNANANRTGQTVIESGTLELRGNGGIGSGAVTIQSGATLAFSREGDWTFGSASTNAISGNGTLDQRGGGVLTLASNLENFSGQLLATSGRIDLGADAVFGGSVMVDDQMTVNGRVTGAVTVRSGGTLGGSGSVGGLTVASGGTVAPGNSIGTLTVTGPVSFAAGSTYAVEADNSGAADRINATGNLTLSGGTVAVMATPNDSANWQPFTAYQILTFGGSRTGTFDEVTTDLAFLDPRLEYVPGAVVLHLDRNNVQFASVALTPNQRQAAAALEALGLGHTVAGPVVPLYDEVLSGTGDDAIVAFDAVSGELHASMAGMILDDSRLVRDALLGRAAAHAGRSASTQVWARALSHSGQSEGDGVSKFERNANGLLVGADHVLGEGQYGFGWSAGHHRNGEAKAKALNSEGEVKSTHIGAYLGTRAEGLGMRAGLSHSWHEVDTARTVAFSGFNEYVVADYKARSMQLFAEADYEIELGEQVVAPFINLAWARVNVERWMEADFLSPIGSTAGLRAGSQKHNATFATLGARSDLALGDRFELQGMLGYRRTLSGDEPKLRLGFVDGNQAFTVQGVPLARDAFVADIGLALRIGQNMRIGAAYNGLIGSDARDHSVEARISIALQ